MKTKYFILAALTVLTAFAGCKKALEETPYTTFTTDYFKTPEGLQSAITSVYAGMRFNYGPIGATLLANMGTDEFSFGDQGNSGQTLELGTYQIPPTNGSILTPWNRNYSNINLCNAILKFAPDVTMSDAARNVIMGEARYLRAHYYLLLVEQFGAVPLDLGSGDLVFTDVAYYGFNRLPTNDVLKKNYASMVNDLIFASQNLPVTRPAGAFRLSQSAALHLLSKVYLYRGYSDAKESTDFNNAYKTAMELINNKAKYGTDLLPDYSLIHKQGNDYNREILYSVERLPMNNVNNEVLSPGTEFAGKANISGNLFTSNYQNAAVVGGVSLIDDRPLQYNRPLRQLAPTAFVYNTVFADKTNDARFDCSFRVMWKVATLRTGADLETFKTKLATVGFALGDTAIYLAPTNARAAQLRAMGKKYKVIGPSEYYSNQNKTNLIYPSLKKYDDSVRNNFQDVSGRPYIVAKLSEVYLIAAEAALQDNRVADAVPLINALRERAAFRSGLNATDLAARKEIMKVTAGQITLDFILDERIRELCGEGLRWPDLAVRKKLVERVKAYNPDGAPNVKDFHNLRPIPQDQINSVVDPAGDPNRNKYQNPGYY